MRQILFIICMAISVITNAQTIIGEWETYDDKTGKKKSVIEIYKVGEKYFGKIKETFVDPGNDLCEKCTGTNENKPIIGLVIIENMKKDDTEYNNGTIIDPESGEIYSSYLELMDDGKLKVRGYVGFSVFGRTQYWRRKK